MTPSEWLSLNEAQLGSPYERLFIMKVLSNVPDLDFSSVESQYPFTDGDGGNRYCDFVLREGSAVRIAIEIDGYDKRGTGSGMSKRDFVDWQRRQSALTSQGWFVLRFANTDVRDYPEYCRKHIELLLRRERQKLQHQDKLTQTIRQLQEKLTKADRRSESGADRQQLAQHISILQQQLDYAKDNEPLSEEENERLKQLNVAQKEISSLKEDNSIMKTTVWAFTALLAVVMIGFIVVGSGKWSAPSQAAGAISNYGVAIASASTSTIGSSCENPASWRHAQSYKGQWVAVEGVVRQVTYRQDIRGTPTWINVGAIFPDKNRLTLVIWGDHRPAFKQVLGQLESKNICAEGTVEIYKGSPQIEMRSGSQLLVQ